MTDAEDMFLWGEMFLCINRDKVNVFNCLIV